MRNRKLATVGVLSLVALLLSIRTVVADTAPAEDNSLTEIVVTAQKREERLQDVPITVAAFTGATLEHASVTTTSDLPMLVSGFVVQERSGSFEPYLRGVGSVDPTVGNESIVSTYVDGIYLVSMPAGLMSLADVDRIEVLKGPQGTLFGRNSVGGVVSIITKTPSQDFHGDVEVGYANYDTVSEKAYVTGGLAPNLSADVAVAYQHQSDGWGRNITTDAAVGFVDYLSVRSKLYLDLPDTKVTLAADYSTSYTDASLIYTPYYKGETLPAGQGVWTGGFYDTAGAFPQFSDVNQHGFSLKIQQDLGIADFTSLSAVRFTNQIFSIDEGRTSLILTNVNQDTDTTDYTQEFQLTSPKGSPVSWIAGIFYLNHDVRPLEDVYQGQYDGDTLLHLNAVQYNYEITTKSLAGYAQATIPIVQGTDFTSGIRYTADDQGWGKEQTLNGTPVPVPDTVAHKQDFDEWTWRFALDHKFTDDVMSYASYNRGFKSGVWNVLVPVPSTSQPEILDAYEIGVKSEFLDHRVRLNAALFDYQYKNMQYNVVVGGTSLVENAADAQIQGLDLDGSIAPIEHLRIDYGAVWLWKRIYTSFPSGVVYIPDGTTIGGVTHTCATPNCAYTGSFEGNEILLAPALTTNLSGDYTIPLPLGDIGLNVAAAYMSQFYRTIDDRQSQPGYTIVNASVRWSPPTSGLTFSAWVKNLNDAEYHTFGSSIAYGYVGGPGMPRTVGVTAGYKF